jgi:hypothetical protein
MIAKQGFDWKKIEEKPDNWETIRRLINDAHTPDTEHRDKYWSNENIFTLLTEMYPDIKPWLAGGPVAAASAADKKKSTSKKATAIIERQTIEMIKTDLAKIRFDKSSQSVILTHYAMEITFVLMIILWNLTFYLRKKAGVTIHKVALLDAIISLYRIRETCQHDDVSPRLHHLLASATSAMESFVDESMYNVLFDNPYLLVQSTADKQVKNARLYKEQHQVLNDITSAIRSRRPILLGNQMPTGTGKTMLSVPLAYKINQMRLKKTVLFACSNELVNQDIACTALLGDDLHVWLARLIRDEENNVHVLLRPYKRCFPATWKKIYKKEDRDKTGTVEEQWNFYTNATKRIPDMIVADLEACYEILREVPSIVDPKNPLALHNLVDPFVAYIDEFISDERSNQIMKQIGRIMPRYSVIISAILPQFDTIQKFVSGFCHRHGTTKEIAVKRVDTAIVNISCSVYDQDGYLAMPHHDVHSEADLEMLLADIRINPRVRRAYTAKHVYYWCKTIDEHLRPAGIGFQDMFPSIGKIRNTAVLDHAIRVLEYLHVNYHLLDKFKAYHPRIMEPPSFPHLFTSQSHYLDGKTLLIANNVYDKVIDYCFEASNTGLFDSKIRWSDLVDDSLLRQKEQEEAYNASLKMTSKKTTRGGGENDSGKSIRINATDMALAQATILETDTTIRFPPEYVINSREHYLRHVPNGAPPAIHTPRNSIYLRPEYQDAFEPEMNMLMSAGVGIYDTTRMTGYQRRLVMEQYPMLMILCSGKEIVFGTNLSSLVNIFIDKSFGDDEHPDVLYQLMGRAGRMGRSYHANVITNSRKTLLKILNFRGGNIDPVVIDFDDSFA